MPTQEDRIDALERKIATMELERLYERRKAEDQTPTAQGYNLKEINQNMAMLLGICSGQERDIKATQSDVSSIKDRLEGIELRLENVERHIERLEATVDRRFTSLEQRFASQEEKFDQVLQLLTALTKKME